MPAAAARSRARAPRSSEPHGRFTVTRSAIPHSSAGRASADATTNRALGRPPRRGDMRRTARGLRHRARDGVDAQHQPIRVRRRSGQDEPAVAGAKVHGHAVAAGGAGRQLADVHLVGSASDHGAHARRVGGRRRRRKRRLPTLAGMSQLPVQPYERAPSAFHPWDPRTADVARELARLIASARPGTRVEHIGSSAVPGLPGKNVVDLGIEADPDEIPALTDALRSLGFGPQGGLAPFPPARPMLTGNVVHDGTSFRVHCHVIPPARGELRELIAFRDALRADPSLRDGYAEAKRRIVEAAPDGEANQLYTARKSDFVQDALYRLGIRHGPADAPEPLAPGATVGVMGGGQLGRMLGLAARAMGYRLVVLDPDPDCPASAVADEVIVGRYDDVAAARRLAEASDVVTYELEHVGLDAAAAAGELRPLRPGLRALEATQDRLAERRFLRSIGEHVAPFREVRGPAEARAAADDLGYPVRLKVPLGGYDGRSQLRVEGPDRARRRRGVPGRGRGPPAAARARDRLRGRAVGRVRPRPHRALAGVPGRPQPPRSRDPRRDRRARPRPPDRRLRRGGDRRLDRPRPGPGRGPDRGAVPAPGGRGADGQRARPARAQQRPLVDRGRGDLAVRAAPARDPRAAAGLRRAARGVGDGQPAGHRPGSRRAPRRASSRPSTIPAPTSTSTASAGCSSGARWAT